MEPVGVEIHVDILEDRREFEMAMIFLNCHLFHLIMQMMEAKIINLIIPLLSLNWHELQPMYLCRCMKPF